MVAIRYNTINISYETVYRPRYILLLLLVSLFANMITASAAEIVAILPLTGRFSPTGETMISALYLAYDNLPRKSRSSFNLIIADNYGNPDSARVLAEYYSNNPEVIALLGGYPSDCCRKVTETANAHEIPHLIISSSEDSLTIQNSRWVFRIAPPSSHYNDGLVGWAATVAGKHRSIAVICEDHTRSEGAVNDLKNDLNSTWQGRTAYHFYDPGNRDNEELTSELSDSNPTIVWMIGNLIDVSKQLRDFRSANWIPVAFALGDAGLVTLDLYNISEGAAEYVYAPTVWWHTAPYPGTEKFASDFTTKHGQIPDYHTAEAYAAIQVINWAIENADQLDREQLRNALQRCDLATVMGKVKFDAFDGFQNQNRTQTMALQLIDKSWRLIWPLELAESNFVYPIPAWNDRETAQSSDLERIWLPFMMFLITGFLVISAIVRRKELMKRMDD